MAAIEHIVFDIGRVLIHWDMEIPYRRLIPDSERRKWFFENVCTPAWNLEQDRGRSWADAEEVLIAEHPGEETNIRAFRKYWHEMIAEPVAGTFEVLEQLVDDGHDVTLLTNFSHETFPQAIEMHPSLSRARGATVSGAVGLLKPDSEIFDHHVERFGLRREAVLFFDDSPRNVEGARNADWQAEIFTSCDQMIADLNKYGIQL